jgi:hypothetical protein
MEWDFGDGTTAATNNVNHTFSNGQHSVNLSVFSNGVCHAKTINFQVNIGSSTIGIANLDNSFKLFPNPANDYIYIENTTNSSIQLKIYNLLGEIVLEQDVEENEKINLSTLTQAGQYIVEIRTADEVKTVKLVKHE